MEFQQFSCFTEGSVSRQKTFKKQAFSRIKAIEGLQITKNETLELSPDGADKDSVAACLKGYLKKCPCCN